MEAAKTENIVMVTQSRPQYALWTRERWKRAYSYERKNGYDRHNLDGLLWDTLFVRNLCLGLVGDGGVYETGPWWMTPTKRLAHIRRFCRSSFLWPGPKGRLP